MWCKSTRKVYVYTILWIGVKLHDMCKITLFCFLCKITLFYRWCKITLKKNHS